MPFSLPEFLRQYSRILIPFAIAVGILGGVALIYHRGSTAGRDAVVKESVKHSVAIREVQNEIRNARPDTDGLVKRMRSHDF